MPTHSYVKPLFKAPDRSPNGIGVHGRANMKGQFGLPDPASWIVDFSEFVSGDLASKWAAVLAVGTSTIAQTAGDGGQILFTTGASSNDAASLVKTATTGQNWAFDITRGFFLEARFQVDDGNLAGFGLGMAVTATGPFSYTSGFMINKPGGGTVFNFETNVASSKTTSSSLGSPTNWACPTATWVTLGFGYKGENRQNNGTTEYAFVVQCDLNDGNGPQQQTIFAAASLFPANTVNLHPTIGVLDSSGVARTMKVDYITVAKERFNA